MSVNVTSFRWNFSPAIAPFCMIICHCPNLIGDPNWDYISSWIGVLREVEFMSTMFMAENFFQRCYQKFNEILCYSLIPKCDPVNNQVIHPWQRNV